MCFGKMHCYSKEFAHKFKMLRNERAYKKEDGRLYYRLKTEGVRSELSSLDKPENSAQRRALA